MRLAYPYRTMPRLHARWACAAAAAPLVAPVSAAPAPDLLSDPFQLSLGAFFVESAPTIALHGESEKGDRLDWGREFGGVDASRTRLDGHWRFSERQKVRVSAFSASRERTKVLDVGIDWGGETYPARASVDADFSFDILEVAYEYALLRGHDYEFNGSLGLHYMTLDASLDAGASASGGALAEDVTRSARLDAPLPVIGFGALWSLRHHLWLDAYAQFFALSTDDYDGNLQSYRVSLTWQPRPWVGIGIGYDLFRISVAADKRRFDGTLDWSYRGPLVFYRASF